MPPESLLFSATLTPHRSLGRNGTIVLIGGVTLFSLITAIPFVVLGAWPVGGFFGLDVLLLIGAFHLNNRSARRSEHIRLSRVELLFRQIGWQGTVLERSFNPLWVKIRREEDPDYGLVRLAIAQGRTEVDVGAFLAPSERADFAAAFQGALADAKRW